MVEFFWDLKILIMKTAWKIFIAIFTATFLLTSLASFVLAQDLSQIAYNVVVKDQAAPAGSIVSYDNGSYDTSSKDYDPALYGVIVSDPSLTLNEISSTTRAVVTSGQVLVRVSSHNGKIHLGDLITSSTDKGVGQKATKSGHVLGKALQDFPASGQNDTIGTIPVLVNINYNQISAQSEGLTQAGINQVASKVSSAVINGNVPSLLKYVFALLLGAISFFVGLSHFVRQNRTAVEAIARNPLAKGDIQKQLIIGTVGILLVSAVGLSISIFILFFL